MPNRGRNVGYNLLLDLKDRSKQLVAVEGELEFPEGTARLRLSGAGNTGPRQNFADRLAEASNKEFAKLCNRYIWLAAYASNNSNSDYHWMADACYYEGRRRGRPDIYNREYDKLVRECAR